MVKIKMAAIKFCYRCLNDRSRAGIYFVNDISNLKADRNREIIIRLYFVAFAIFRPEHNPPHQKWPVKLENSDCNIDIGKVKI